MAPSPQEPQAQITTEQYFLATDFVSGVGYGAQIVLYLMCAIYLWGRRKTQKSYMYILLYMTLLLSLSTVSQVGQAHRAQMVLIDNRSPPGAPRNTSSVTALLTDSANFALLFFTELFVLWRCWVVWCAAGRYIALLVVTLPGLMLLGAVATGIRFTLAAAYPGSVILTRGALAWGGAYYTLIFATNILLTCLILARLIMHRRKVMRNFRLGNTQEYCSLITMLVESAAVYSIISAACLVTYWMRIPVNQPFVSASITSQQISSYLIIVRLAHGQSWKKDTYERELMVKINTMVSSDSHLGEQTSKPENVGYR